jgi:hypothetical protein
LWRRIEMQNKGGIIKGHWGLEKQLTATYTKVTKGRRRKKGMRRLPDRKNHRKARRLAAPGTSF